MKPTPITPGPGQESVWDYPRPPRLEDTNKRLRVIVNGTTIAETTRAKRVLETSHPPAYYIPSEDIKLEYLIQTSRQSWCEWKGRGAYYDLKMGELYIPEVAWRYPQPTSDFIDIQDYYSFYAEKMEACYVDEELVQPQAGNFYGGWITKDVVGPFKGGPGTMGW